MKLLTRRVILTFQAAFIVSSLTVLFWSGLGTRPHIFRGIWSRILNIYGTRASPIQLARQEAVAEAFQHGWNGYSKYCFGHDTLHPVSKTCENDFGGWGATAIDSVTTAILLGKEDVVLQILQFIANLDLRVLNEGDKIQVFEVVIRHLGAMISTWDLLNGPFHRLANDQHLRNALYERMVELGDLLSFSFQTPSGVPRNWLDPVSLKTDSSSTNAVAGAGTMILEFARLSDITGNKTYVDLARRAEDYLLKPKVGEPYPGLLGSHVSVYSGKIVNTQGSWGAFSDSFYEYLIKAYMYDSSTYGAYLERWAAAADSTMKYIGSHPYGHPKWTLLASWNGKTLTNKMETLSWFSGGNFILGGMVTNNQTLVDFGLSIADAAGGIYNMTTTGLGPEFVSWSTECNTTKPWTCDPDRSIWISDARYRLRPEVLETWYHAYRATKDPKYREWSWSAFEAVQKYCRTDTGFSALRDVDKSDGGGKTDVQESFVFAEVMKYVYLIQSEDESAPYHVRDSRIDRKNEWVYNTEAHPLKVVGPLT